MLNSTNEDTASTLNLPAYLLLSCGRGNGHFFIAGGMPHKIQT